MFLYFMNVFFINHWLVLNKINEFVIKQRKSIIRLVGEQGYVLAIFEKIQNNSNHRMFKGNI